MRALLSSTLAFLCTTLLLNAAQPVKTSALFREGQTFITWQEDVSVTGEKYRIYRHSKPITSSNLAKAKMLIEVAEGSSKFQEMWTKNGSSLLTSRKKKVSPWIIERLCIQSVGDDNKPVMLSKETGLLVLTVKEEETESYYAVTTVTNGTEDKTVTKENTCGPIKEKKEPIGAVLYYRQSAENKKTKKIEPSKDWYIMYMDPEIWNVDYIGYAFPFAITLRAFKEGGSMPSIHLDGIGTMNVFSANYSNYGAGDFSKNALPTWYFGYGTEIKDRNQKKGGWETKQEIANYIQYRIMQTVLWSRRKYKITDPRFHINGNSMGASGAIGFAMAFPKFVTSIWSNEGYTDYANTRKKNGKWMWQSSMWGNYGKPELGNKVKLLPFGSPQMDWYLKFNGMNVFDFRNAAKFLAMNVGEDFPLMMIGHCHQDGSIPPSTQAYPFEKYIKDSRHCFSYAVSKGGHGWGQAMKGSPMQQYVRWDESRPGFSGVPGIIGWKYNQAKFKDPTSRTYCLKVQWGVSKKPLSGKKVEETEDSWSMPFKHAAKFEQDYFVDITPRNLQKLKVKEGDTFTFTITSLDGKPLEIADFSKYANGDKVKDSFKNSGEIKGDKHNLLLIPNVPIDKSGCLVEVKRK